MANLTQRVASRKARRVPPEKVDAETSDPHYRRSERRELEIIFPGPHPALFLSHHPESETNKTFCSLMPGHSRKPKKKKLTAVQRYSAESVLKLGTICLRFTKRPDRGISAKLDRLRRKLIEEA